MKYSVSLLVTLFVGIGLGFVIDKMINPKAPVANSELQMSSVSEKIAEIDSNELTQMNASHDASEKLKLANQALAKILKLFLLDLGIRTNPENIKMIEASAEAPPKAEMPHSTPASLNTHAAAQTLKTTAEADKGSPNKPAPQEVRNETDVADFLSKSSLSDFMGTWKVATNPTAEQISQINGSYKGSATLKDPKEPMWDITVDVDAKRSSSLGTIDGKFDVTLAKLGKVFSNGRSRGDNINAIKSAPDGSILLDVMGGRGFLQLFYFPQLNSFQGNIYKEITVGAIDNVGSFTLTKD